MGGQDSPGLRSQDGWYIVRDEWQREIGNSEAEFPPEGEMSNRREFLKDVAGAAAGVFLTGSGLLDAAASRLQSAGPVKRREISVGGRRVKTVDLHCHCYPD